jgi:hypothetical protein
MLGRKGDGGDVRVSALLQSTCPGALGICFLVDDPQVRSRAVDQQGNAMSTFDTNLPLGPCVTNEVITGGAALMLYQR